ncbi:MAG: TIGR04053 family radical SAM/SPASM domain-containing protein [Nitrososphaeria archaeon]|jgi:radical SAM protein
MDFDLRPILVFWETTRACGLACRHCRASAMPERLPGELDTREGVRLLEQISGFGDPKPMIIFTGGDPLIRDDLEDLVSAAKSLGIRASAAPAVTPLLTPERLRSLSAAGLSAVSISLDGASPSTHDWVRRSPGHFRATLEAVRAAIDSGLKAQLNSLVFDGNVEEIPGILSIAGSLGVDTLEFFYLVKVGRAAEGMEELTPAEYEDLSAFLVDATSYCFTIRTVEGPFIRRIAAGGGLRRGSLYNLLSRRARELLGEPKCTPSLRVTNTRDGKGVIFVAYNGDVYPSGFLPLPLGNVRRSSLVDIYRGSPVLRSIRAAEFRGRCGACEYRDVCGGSRSRAFAALGDPLGEDPACPYIPRAMARAPSGGAPQGRPNAG